jgi:hypothetical protein
MSMPQHFFLSGPRTNSNDATFYERLRATAFRFSGHHTHSRHRPQMIEDGDYPFATGTFLARSRALVIQLSAHRAEGAGTATSICRLHRPRPLKIRAKSSNKLSPYATGAPAADGALGDLSRGGYAVGNISVAIVVVCVICGTFRLLPVSRQHHDASSLE